MEGLNSGIFLLIYIYAFFRKFIFAYLEYEDLYSARSGGYLLLIVVINGSRSTMGMVASKRLVPQGVWCFMIECKLYFLQWLRLIDYRMNLSKISPEK